MIPFSKPYISQIVRNKIEEVLSKQSLCGNGFFCKEVENFFKKTFLIKKILLTASATQSLEMMALLLDIKAGDEIIAPSFTFVSSVNAFVLRGARVKFVDINPKTMNLDENLIEQAITKKTKAIIPVHYAGISCEMDRIIEIAKHYKIAVCEDAAQGVNAFYKGKSLGSIGDFGAFSFHETKNYTSGGEGGALVVNNEEFCQRAEILQEKGTNRSLFFQGMVDKYTWVDLGSSFLLSELQAAFLMGQLEEIDEILQKRLMLWNEYYKALLPLKEKGCLELPFCPDHCAHNGHIFYIKVRDLDQRKEILEFLRKKGIIATFHYIPLHASKAGLKFGEFVGLDRYTTKESERLLRLPLYYDLDKASQEKVISSLYDFWKEQ
ncbi:dTDP-4-amino-4,6-dideoxygalactose transaminase [Helicobacter winghamensis]|uniref:dTDP-4-amino-4,6-dideoxygalactose transaminase n=1 Tax=Helicobacter winghamensis TaxID=157268 RepID=A0A2N3PJ54_9HELI|nr:dTDP-4-amino-4,6-dideoxygalactose transaminase [Helicobacter winghamensis]EEO25475.1 dTDP-4-amino-4,6-dideoxy-D-glucose transaminase [Helicobacter winghamensis ATCC BAA-430]PKT78100.1 dTDP-4-amino-4,6-dideoxygalactose transaminase [Helicobacter winghamensis]PKT78366.1 dTDP-4-amino-4,6-dideoxygalactose transaminase [Helicobacter winghamensis]PKT78628.1 dTDP-4-amino-4,6-dideoxygalactose transaminase [Helicobacter winghamensis]PKT81050.1 dTDP-4-amino-4,6-dideoxygalactose transaminase [Helicoba